MTRSFILASHWPKDRRDAVSHSIYRLLISDSRQFDYRGFIDVNTASLHGALGVLSGQPSSALLLNGAGSLFAAQSVSVLEACQQIQYPVVIYWHETSWMLRTFVEKNFDRYANGRRILDGLQVEHWFASSQSYHSVAMLYDVNFDGARIVGEVVEPREYDLEQVEVVERQRCPPLFIGGGVPNARKGLDLFCDLAIDLPQYEFLWFGTPGSRNSFPKEGVPANLSFRAPSAEFHKEVRRASALALTSRDDPMPLVALIALASDVPVVAFKSTGMVEVLDPDFVCGSRSDMKNRLVWLAGRSWPEGFFKAKVGNMGAKAFSERVSGDVPGTPVKMPPLDIVAKVGITPRIKILEWLKNRTRKFRSRIGRLSRGARWRNVWETYRRPF